MSVFILKSMILITKSLYKDDKFITYGDYHLKTFIYQ